MFIPSINFECAYFPVYFCNEDKLLDSNHHYQWFAEKNRLVAAVEAGNVSSLTALLSEMTPVEAANAEDVAGNTVVSR